MPEQKTLYTHVAHPHQVRNVNYLHKAEQEAAGFNQRLAVWITKATSSMWTAYLFTLLALIGLFGLFGWLNPFTFLLATWVSQQFLQLVFLPILSVGQATLNRKAELQSEESYHCVLKTSHDLEQVAQHLAVQDQQLLGILALLEQQSHALEAQSKLIETLQSRRYF